MARRTLIALGLAGFWLLPACGERIAQPQALDPRVLHGFESCDEMLAFTESHALEMLDAYGEFDGFGVPGVDEDSGDDGEGGGEGAPDHSDTNVQEAGVDEPDVIKTDGERILAIAQGELHYIDASGMVAELQSSLPLPDGWGPEMFLWEDRVLIINRADNWEIPKSIQPEEWQGDEAWVELTTVIEVDISDPQEMKVLRTLHLGGGYVSARLVDSVARIVIRSNPIGLDLRSAWDFYPDRPRPGWENGAQSKAKAHNKEVLAGATPENWLPQYIDDRGDEASHGLLVECSQTMRPGAASGTGLLSVLTVDMADDLSVGEATGVFSSGETVYASKDALYVATYPWWFWGWGWEDGVGVDGDGGSVEPEPVPPPEPGDPSEEGEVEFRSSDDDGMKSYIHKFDITDSTRADYVASGEVRGYLLSQWSMSEHEGDLRVATTDTGTGGSTEPESYVSVLRQGEAGLEQIGQVGGLGLGEQIYAVRMMGDTGYVVTFRQVDPLYTVDLSDPAVPEVMGELKIPGYSAYLHPVGEGRLLGVGQNATDEGQLLGAQVSLFDVSDLGNPTRLHTYDLGQGSTDVEWDHRAFLYWEPENLAAIPVQSWWWDEDEEHYDAHVVGLRIDEDAGFVHVGDIDHPSDPDEYYDWLGVPRRSMVIGDAIYTLSERGLKASNIDDFSDRAWIEF